MESHSAESALLGRKAVCLPLPPFDFEIEAPAYFCSEPLLTSDDKPDETKLDLTGLAHLHRVGFNPELKEYQDACAFIAISVVLIFDTESDSFVSFTLQIRFPQKLQESPNDLLSNVFCLSEYVSRVALVLITSTGK
ncbi:hypothetical protein FOXG_21505 [Fusarium oxysporum f. sp. lycopersici 4287]|uniref:Uncharacterized protein n=1 Tax=Fusarium oxysporum f. sp. lycopersici (strain 4287 / CBS 123668 / FGSC 9935 / NRRL 34936) TaxID=426428 RepID=A0A0J9VYI9_FUSO4|nr:hypothetical protein FOXG_21505 [Fusarium oxysporum f. sp. lycopersici 4287]EWZ78058.1 hypothetical protein FOWG_17610 [Fusarium oxysporum f. sp. lycopersici MN25]KNB15841.1 hypothetical protein FOXG_21505 [Fusarium oxysporum f. sp. lycopersici 4287]